MPLETVNGEIFDIHTSGSPFFDEKGDCTGGIFITENITETKRLVEELKASEEMYRSIFDNVPVGIFTINNDGYVMAINPYQLEHIDGGKAEDYSGKFNSMEFTKKHNLEVHSLMENVLKGRESKLSEISSISASKKQI